MRELPEPFMSGRKPVFLSALVTSSLSARKSRAINWPSQPTPLASSPPGGSLLFPGFGTEPFALALPAHNSQANCSNTTATKLFASCLLNLSMFHTRPGDWTGSQHPSAGLVTTADPAL